MLSFPQVCILYIVAWLICGAGAASSARVDQDEYLDGKTKLFENQLTSAPLMSKDEAALRAATFHFPPLSYDPDLSGSQQPGLMTELLSEVYSRIGLRVKKYFYPPSRFHHVIGKGKVDYFTSGYEVAERYKESYDCSSKAFYYVSVVLYQNTSMQSRIYRDIRAELRNVRILSPKENRQFFLPLVHTSNVLVDLVLPRNMTRMFFAQREAFMINYPSRVEAQVDGFDHGFEVKKHLLAQDGAFHCIHKKIPNSKQKVQLLYQVFRSFEGLDVTRQLEAKYSYKIKWAKPKF